MQYITATNKGFVSHFPHPPLSQSVFAEFCEPKWSVFIHKSGEWDWRSPVQFRQTPKIRSVTVQGAECGLFRSRTSSDGSRIGKSICCEICLAIPSIEKATSVIALSTRNRRARSEDRRTQRTTNPGSNFKHCSLRATANQ